MYNPTEQIAEINKTNVAQATKFAALSLENAEKFTKFNLGAAKAVFAQSSVGFAANPMSHGLPSFFSPYPSKLKRCQK